jgi:adenosylcobinamide-GDP ribazoletransferase
VATVIAVAVALATLRADGVVALLLAAAAALGFAAFMARRLGGVSGDVHGAAVELSELVVLLTAAAAHPAR